jgi:hypothetical protein
MNEPINEKELRERLDKIEKEITELKESINIERTTRLSFEKQMIDHVTNKLTNTTTEEREQDRIMNDFYRNMKSKR